MVTARKVSLPLAGEAPRLPPTVDAVRARLGGRVQEPPEVDPAVGTLVQYEEGSPEVGAVLFARDGGLDVWLGDGRVKRVGAALAKTVAHEAHPSNEMLAMLSVAADARAFRALPEGARVRFTAKGTLGEGTLVEKCRYGALVLRDDGSIAGVGFRALWPHTGGP